jgi:hypothetical protein
MEEIKATLARSLEGIRTVFGELTFGFLTVIDRTRRRRFDLTRRQRRPW